MLVFTGCDEAETAAAAPSDVGTILEPTPDVGSPPEVPPGCIAVPGDGGDWAIECEDMGGMAQPDAQVETALTLAIQSPGNGTRFDQGEAISLTAFISSMALELEFVAVEVTTGFEEQYAVVFDRETGAVSATVVGLPPGLHTITMTARAVPDIEVSDSVEIVVDCGYRTDFSSALDDELWAVRGNARLDARGWLEMTNNQTDAAGGIFLVGRTVDPGDLDVSFKISAGGDRCPEPDVDCLDAGGQPRPVADGFAVSFWNIGPADLDTLWSVVGYGGTGAGYGSNQVAAAGLERGPEGFTIEFDLYANSCPPNGFWDPHHGPHVEIQQNGRFFRGAEELTSEERCALNDFSAEEGQTWIAYPQIADNYWHDVTVSIRGRQVSVTIDEGLVLETELPDFRFKGGLLAFSGGSGSVSAYQRFDELVLESNCPQ